MTSRSTQDRIYFLDAMRSVLMTLGVILHSANVFSDTTWAIQNTETSELFAHFVTFIHYFRMPAFFIVSGFFCHMTISRYGYKKFLSVRIPRIVIPLVVTAITLNTLQNMFVMNDQTGQFSLFDIHYWLEGKWVSHLWFLNCLIYYFLAAALLHAYLPNILPKSARLLSATIIRSNGYYLLVFPLLSILFIKISYITTILPENYYDFSVSDSIKFSIYFIFGALLSFNRKILQEFIKPKISCTFIIILICLSLLAYSQVNDSKFVEFYINNLITWILCLVCFYLFQKFFNKESPFFNYFSGASYTIYLFHHFFVIFYGLILISLDLNIIIKFIFLITFTFITTTLIHHYLILRIPVMRYLFNGKRG